MRNLNLPVFQKIKTVNFEYNARNDPKRFTGCCPLSILNPLSKCEALSWGNNPLFNHKFDLL